MKIDPAEYQKRLYRLSEILNGIAQHAAELSASRCASACSIGPGSMATSS